MAEVRKKRYIEIIKIKKSSTLLKSNHRVWCYVNTRGRIDELVLEARL